MLFGSLSNQENQQFSGPELPTKTPLQRIVGCLILAGMLCLALSTIYRFCIGDLPKEPTPPTINQAYTFEQYCGLVHLVDKDGSAIADAYYGPGSTKSISTNSDLYKPYEYSNGCLVTFDFPAFPEYHLEHIRIYSDYPVKDHAIYTATEEPSTTEGQTLLYADFLDHSNTSSSYHFIYKATADACEFQTEEPPQYDYPREGEPRQNSSNSSTLASGAGTNIN